MRLDSGPMRDDEFVSALAHALLGGTVTDHGASQPMGDLLAEIAARAFGAERDELVDRARRLHADESPQRRRTRPLP